MLAFAALPAAPASADLTGLFATCASRDAADANTGNGLQLGYRFCDDGVPDFGGVSPNPTAAKAVAVPAAYTGSAEPVKDAAAALTVPGNAAAQPRARRGRHAARPGRGPHAGRRVPGDRDDARLLRRQQDGLGGGQGRRRRRALALLERLVRVARLRGGDLYRARLRRRRRARLHRADAARLRPLRDQRLPAPGGAAGRQGRPRSRQRRRPEGQPAAGGGDRWLVRWRLQLDGAHRSGLAQPRRNADATRAAAPKYGWSNLLESLVPNGADPRDALPDPAKAGSPIGFPKRSIVSALYLSGKTGVPPGSSHTTFPPDIDQAQSALREHARHHAAAVPERTLRLPGERFFARLANGTLQPVPVFSAGTFTDPLFPPAEHRRMAERLKATVPGYPVQEYYGDYQHFVQNKAKEWGDVCGADRHVCRYGDYAGGNMDATPAGLAR